MPTEDEPKNPAAATPPAQQTAGLDERLAFLRLGPDDSRRLQRLRQRFDEQAEPFVKQFYGHLLAFAPTAQFLRDPELVERLQQAQMEHLAALLAADWSEALVERCRSVGDAHARVGLAPHLFIGAFNEYVQYWIAHLDGEKSPAAHNDSLASIAALVKAVFLDLGLALDAYFLRSTENLRQALEMYWKAHAELRQFAQLASHDLKTPLATVANLCDEAIDEFGDQMPTEALELIERAQQRIYRMSGSIDELLANSTQLKQRPAASRTSAAQVVLEAVDAVRPALDAKEIEVVVTDELPAVAADRVRMREIFSSVLYTVASLAERPQGKIWIDGRQSDNECVFTIRNDCASLGGADLERVFSPFGHLLASQDMPPGRPGLYLSRSLAEQLGGRLSAALDGSTATFSIALPAAD